jgi:UDP:flavonoid glycosyltransferase YjiC (YdhE family)
MARILFAFAGGSGHADPLVPIAVAARKAGHDVAFFGRRSGAGAAEAAGFSLMVDPDEARGDPNRITPLVEIDMEREYRVLGRGFADRMARARAGRLLTSAADRRPDLVVCDEFDFGSMIAAEELRIPHAIVLVNASRSFVRPDVVADALAPVRREHGLSPDPDLAAPARHLVVSPFPPSLRDPAHPLPTTAMSIRWEAATAGEPPAWLDRVARPTVYATLGTIFNAESGDLFARLLAALGRLPGGAVLTVGRQIDPTTLGDAPSNVRVERYVPQAALLPRCDVVVNHAGSGSLVGALAHGVPLVMIPMGADQPLNAERCERLGAGVTLDAIRSTSREIAAAVSTVLDAPSYRTAAERLREEIQALPPASATIPLLERLVNG